MSGNERSKGAIRHIVRCQTSFKCQPVLAPPSILLSVDMWGHILDVETIVPVNHVPTHIIALFVMSSQARVSVALNVIVMAGIVAADHFFEAIALLKFHVVEVHDRFQDTLTSFILCHKLDQLIYDSLEVGVSFITQFAVAV